MAKNVTPSPALMHSRRMARGSELELGWQLWAREAFPSLRAHALPENHALPHPMEHLPLRSTAGG